MSTVKLDFSRQVYNAARNDYEDFEYYRERRRVIAIENNRLKKGTVVWVAAKMVNIYQDQTLPPFYKKVLVGGAYKHAEHSPKVGRNKPCPCGSGKKHKKCCY